MEKRTFVEGLVIFIVVFCSFSTHADFIKVISQDYAIQATAIFYKDQTYNKYYQEASSIPISLFEQIDGSSDDWAGGVELSASASGDVSALSALVYCGVGAYDIGDAVAYASSSASITFSPLVSKMIITGEIWSYASTIYLFDLTINQTLYLLHEEAGAMQSESSILDFDLSHIYSINIETDMINNWSTTGFLRIAPVPEPATIILLGFGLTGGLGS